MFDIKNIAKTLISDADKEENTELHYKNYGNLLFHWRNEVKLSKDCVSKNTGISTERLKWLEMGKAKPDWDELERLAKTYFVSVKDLLPYDDDLDRDVKILRDKDARYFDQERNGKLQYTYAHRAMSSTLPNFKPVELELHLFDKEEVVLNKGHFFHQFTQVLHGGPVGFVWQDKKGTKHYEEFIEGDSWQIPGYIPHGFWSPDPTQKGKILAITYGQYLAGNDARQELNLIGKENAGRIVEDGSYY